MMAEVIIVGASGFGMEVLWLAERCGRTVRGFLDDTPEKRGASVQGVPVLGEVQSWQEYKDCELVLAIGSPQGRRVVDSKIRSLGEPVYATLIDPTAVVGKSVMVAEGAVICAGVVCTAAITIGRHVILNLNSTVGHETAIGDFCTVAPGVSLSGNVVLETCVELGTGACIREKLNIGAGSVVGMGCVLTKSVESNCVVVGNPGKVLRHIE